MARSLEFLKAGEISINKGTNLLQFWMSKLNSSIKVSFFQLQFQYNIIYLSKYNRSSLSRDHQTATITNYCYSFYKLESESQIYSSVYMLWLSYRTWGEHLNIQLWWGTARLVVICLCPINPLNGLLSVRCLW